MEQDVRPSATRPQASSLLQAGLPSLASLPPTKNSGLFSILAPGLPGNPCWLLPIAGPTHTGHLRWVCPAGPWTQLCTQTLEALGWEVKRVQHPQLWEGLQALGNSLTSPVSTPN